MRLNRLHQLSLGTRLAAAMMAVVLVLSLAFGCAVQQFIELLEIKLLDENLGHELAEFVAEFTQNPDPQLADPTNGRYIASPATLGKLPKEIQSLTPGLHEHIRIDNSTYFVGSHDVGGYRLFLTIDVQPVEQLEDQVFAAAAAIGLIGLVIASLVALVLARFVTGPVAKLAATVSGLNPNQRGVRLASEFMSPELRQIASALDRYLCELDAFIIREQNFTEDASHELRTPVASILTAAELMADQPELSPATQARVQRIIRAAKQQHQLIEALLILARDSQPLMQNRIDLQGLLGKIVQDCLPLLKNYGAVLHADLAPAWARAHPGMVESIISNLLLNAAQHARGCSISITLSAGQIRIQDQGIGIAVQNMVALFERKQRGENSRGLGLGLYLVQSMCARLQWGISVESSAQGSVFILTF